MNTQLAKVYQKECPILRSLVIFRWYMLMNENMHNYHRKVQSKIQLEYKAGLNVIDNVNDEMLAFWANERIACLDHLDETINTLRTICDAVYHQLKGDQKLVLQMLHHMRSPRLPDVALLRTLRESLIFTERK